MKHRKILINKYFYAITGRIDLFYTAVKQYFGWTLLILSVLLNNLFSFRDSLSFFFNLNLEKYLTSFWLLLLVPVSALVMSFRRYHKLIENIMIETLDESDKTALKETLSLPHDYQKSGYQVSVFEKGTYGKEYYVMSPVINQLLQEGKNSPLLFKAPNYNLPAVLLELLPKIMKVNLSKNRFMNNGKLVRQHQSLLIEHFKDGGHIGIGKVGYYDGQCSHEIVYKNFYHQQEIGLYFSGKRLLSNEDNELYSLTNSRSANFLGASTLVITADRHLLIARQGANSKANRNRYAPSGSGSVEWQKDYRQLNPSNLDALIISAMEREFCEEWGLSDRERALMTTGLIGYARLLERGGKPDYFGITYIDKGYEELVASQDKMSYREIGLQQKSDIKLTFTRIDDIYQQLERFCQQSLADDLLSIQVHLITEIIKEMTVEGRFTAFMNGLGLFD